MKRIIACMIALALFVMAFAGCSATTDGENNAPVESTQPDVEPSTEPSTEPVVEEDAINPLENAKEYIYQIYKNVASKTPADYQVVGVVVVNGVTYQIEWTAAVNSGAGDAVAVAGMGEDKMVTIDVNEACAEESAYTLTATIKDEQGNSAQQSFERIVPKGFDLGTASYDEIVAAAYELEEDAALEGTLRLFGTIVSIDTPFSAEYNNITVTIAVKGMEEYPVQCYRLSGEGADKLAEGDAITVEGSIKNYKGTIEFDKGCVLIPADALSGAKTLAKAYALEPDTEMKGVKTLTGTIASIDTPYSDEYKNITVTIVVGGLYDYAIQCFRLSGEGADKLAEGDVITVTGAIKNYKGTVEFDAGCTFVKEGSIYCTLI